MNLRDSSINYGIFLAVLGGMSLIGCIAFAAKTNNSDSRDTAILFAVVSGILMSCGGLIIKCGLNEEREQEQRRSNSSLLFHLHSVVSIEDNNDSSSYTELH